MAITFELFKELYTRLKKGDFPNDRTLARDYKVNRNCLYQIRQRKHKFFEILGESEDPNEAIVFPALTENENGKKIRCKTCGNTIQAATPCFICAIRDYKAKSVNSIIEKLEGKKSPK